MTPRQEARTWILTGVIWFVIGLVVLAIDLWRYGAERVSSVSLTVGIAAAFLMFGGLCGVIFGRVLLAYLKGEREWEPDWRQALGFLAAFIGGVVIVATALRINDAPTLNDVGRGLGGAFLAMAGITSLFAHRLIYHFTRPLERQEEKKTQLPSAA
jgi:hypothetical protein